MSVFWTGFNTAHNAQALLVPRCHKMYKKVLKGCSGQAILQGGGGSQHHVGSTKPSGRRAFPVRNKITGMYRATQDCQTWFQATVVLLVSSKMAQKRGKGKEQGDISKSSRMAPEIPLLGGTALWSSPLGSERPGLATWGEGSHFFYA